MVSEDLGHFIVEECQKRGLSLRSLSLKSGLGAATVHSIITRKYQPTLFSLNRLADYLGVKRQYLWQLAGLLDDMDYDDKSIADPELRYQLARADNLPQPARGVMVKIIKWLITFLEIGGNGG